MVSRPILESNAVFASVVIVERWTEDNRKIEIGVEWPLDVAITDDSSYILGDFGDLCKV